MKKIFRVITIIISFLCIGISLPAQTYDMSQKKEVFRIKFNVYDFTSYDPAHPEKREPVPGVKFKVNFRGDGKTTIWKNHGTQDADGFISIEPSDIYGVSYYSIGYAGTNLYPSHWSSKDQKYIQDWDKDNVFLKSVSYIDCDPLPESGYQWHLYKDGKLDLQAGKIRNFVSGSSNVSRISMSGIYDNITYKKDDSVINGICIEMDVYVELINPSSSVHTVQYDLSEIASSEHSNYPTLQYNYGSTISSIPNPTNKSHPTWKFEGWTIGSSTTAFVPGTTQIKHNMTLVPHWSRVGDAKGEIIVRAYLWDHEAYSLAPKEKLTTPIRVNGVLGNYKAEDYTSNAGWGGEEKDWIPLEGARLLFKGYGPNISGLTEDDKYPIGYAKTDNWQKNTNHSRVTTNSDGYAKYELTSAQLQLMAEQGMGAQKFRLDCDSDSDVKGYFDRKKGKGREYAVFDWDWQIYREGGQSSAVPGVRFIKEGERHDNTGTIHLVGYNENAINDNDAAIIDSDMLENGFSLTYICFFAAGSAVDFDPGDGVMTNPDPAKYPIQKFGPIRSSGEKFCVQDPGNPILSSQDFAGWHEMIYTGDIAEPDPNPYDFTRNVSYSFTLKALYTDKTYKVRWANYDWESQSFIDEVPPLIEKDLYYTQGNYPTYDKSTLPTKPSTITDDYIFTGWDLYKQDEFGTITFGSIEGKYVSAGFVPIGSMTEVIVDPELGLKYYKSPVQIDGGDQIYIAHFEKELNVVWKLRNNVAIAKYKTLYDAVNNIDPAYTVSGNNLALADGDCLEFHNNTTEVQSTTINKDNITICSAENKQFTIQAFLSTAGTTSQHAAGITVTGDNVQFSRITLAGNNQTSEIKNTHTLMVSGGNLKFGNLCNVNGHVSTATSYGSAAVYVKTGSLIIDGATLSGNSSVSSAGAITNDGTLTITSGTFSNNSGSEGGAVDNNGTLNLNGGTFTGNSSTATGSGVYPKGNAIIQRNNLLLSGNPSFENDQDIYLVASRTTSGGTGDVHTITKSGSILSSSIPLRLGPELSNIYLGRNVLESGSTAETEVVNEDLDKLTILNDSDLSDKILKLGFTHNDSESLIPVLELVKITSKITITKSGLQPGESAIFTLSKGDEKRIVALTGKTGASSVSVTVSNLDNGEWTITENMKWAWSYLNYINKQRITINPGDSKTISFTNEARIKTPAHAESAKENKFETGDDELGGSLGSMNGGNGSW